MGLSRAKLTPAEEEFWRLMLVRATSEDIGQPYLSYALFELTPISAPGLKTAGVDKRWNCYVDFEHMFEKGIKYASAVLNHEPWHLLRDHMARFENLDALDNGQSHNAKAWNIAGDLTINGDIPKLVPDDGCFPEKGIFKKYKQNGITEDYYAQLMSDEDFKPKPCPECGEGGEKDKSDKDESGKDDGDEKGDQSGDDESDSGDGDDGEGEGSGDGDSDAEGDNADGGAGNAHGKNGKGQPCSTCQGHGKGQGESQGQGNGTPDPNCGSGAGNPLKDYELSEGEAPGVDAERVDQIRQATAEAVKEYARSNPGSIPGNTEVWAEQTLKAPAPDWRSILRGTLQASIAWKRGQLDYNRTRRNRRQTNPRIISPALMAPRPRLAVGIDVSGSHVHKLGIVVDQIVEIVKTVGIRDKELMAFGVDVRATDPKFVQNPHNVLKEMVGGGGTDMCVAFEVFRDLDRKNKADISLLLTDLQTGWPTERPAGKMKHIVCGIVDSRQGWEMEWVTRAEEAIGSWATLVIIDVAEGEN
jgi:predicted metal-dependent peptidase